MPGAFDTIKSNIAVRQFAPEVLTDSQILRILEAARLSQSGKNLQPWFFIVIRNRMTLSLLADLMEGDVDESTVRTVQLAIALVGNPEGDSYLFDLGRSVQNMTLAAWELGIGSCMMSGPEPTLLAENYKNRVMDVLKIPKNLAFVSLLVFGIPSMTPRSSAGNSKKKRKDILEIAFSETFGEYLNLVG